jgi:uncharacterized Zn finger protein (UPF0148 family)
LLLVKTTYFLINMPTLRSLKRITDPDFLLCHRCGLPLRSKDGEYIAHKKCAEAANLEARTVGKKESKIKRASSTRPFEGIGTIGHSPCRLDDGSVMIPADEVAKIRKNKSTNKNARAAIKELESKELRELREEEEPEEVEEVEEVNAPIEDWEWELLEEDQDLFTLAYGRTETSELPELTRFILGFLQNRGMR